AKEPASAPRKGGGTANFGVDISLAPRPPRACSPETPPSRRAAAVAHERPSCGRIHTHACTAPQPGMASLEAWRKGVLICQMSVYSKYTSHDARAAPRSTSCAGRARYAHVRRRTATWTSVSTHARETAPRVPLHGVGRCHRG